MIWTAFTEFERKNKYCVVNVRGERVFYVVEDSTKCARCCWEPSSRPCKLEVFDNSRKEILRMVLPCRCHSGCCFCCPQEMEVYSGDTLLGTVTENWSSWRTSFSVRDAPRETVLTIKGPWCESSSNLEFQVRPADGEHKVGDIKKQWSGLGTELFTNADHFGINFPLDLDVKMKALLLGACLLIDLMYVKETADDCMETVGPGCELLRLIVECITCIQCMAE